MFEHAVLACDLATGWEVVRRRIHKVQRAGIRHLTLLHAMGHGLPGLSSERSRTAEELRGALEEAAMGLRREGFVVDHRLLVGDPGLVIDDYLERTDANLVIAGAHHHTPIGEFFLGSTIRDLARDAGWAVWLEPLDHEPPADGVLLLATNASQGAAGAESCARALRPRYRSAVALYVDETGDEARREQALTHIRERLPDFTVCEASGRAAGEIVRAVAENTAELLVLGRSSHGSLRDLIWGSTAERICRRPPSSVLLVPHDRAPGAA